MSDVKHSLITPNWPRWSTNHCLLHPCQPWNTSWLPRTGHVDPQATVCFIPVSHETLIGYPELASLIHTPLSASSLSAMKHSLLNPNWPRWSTSHCLLHPCQLWNTPWLTRTGLAAPQVTVYFIPVSHETLLGYPKLALLIHKPLSDSSLSAMKHSLVNTNWPRWSTSHCQLHPCQPWNTPWLPRTGLADPQATVCFITISYETQQTSLSAILRVLYYREGLPHPLRIKPLTFVQSHINQFFKRSLFNQDFYIIKITQYTSIVCCLVPFETQL